MKYVTMSTRGRITIPAAIRKRLRLRAGMKVAFFDLGDKIYVEPIGKHYIQRLSGKFGKKRGMLKYLMEEKKREREREL